MSINIFFLNCKSINCKLAEIKLLIYSKKPDIFCFSETWLSPKMEPNFIGYRSYWKHRPDGYGGVGILVKLSLNVEEIDLVPMDGGVLET